MVAEKQSYQMLVEIWSSVGRVYWISSVLILGAALTLFVWTGKPWVVLGSIGVGGAVANMIMFPRAVRIARKYRDIADRESA